MKKNAVSKIIAGALASTMVLSMAACGGSEESVSGSSASTSSSSSVASSSSSVASSTSSEATPAPTEVPGPDMTPLSITIALPSDNAHTDPNEYYDKLVAELNEALQMDITWKWSANYYDHYGLDIVSGDVADVMVVGKDATFTKAAEEGLFWDLTPYIDDYENLSTIPEATRANASYNGKMYGIPRSRTLARHGMGYRVDWLNNLGLKEPTDWDSFYNMLYAFTYNDPDGNGVDDTVGLFLDSWLGAMDIMMMWFGVPNEWGIDANGDLIHQCQTAEYKEALTAFRQLYGDGLINNGSNGIPDFREVPAGKARDEGWRPGLGGCGVQTLDDLRKVQTYFEGEGITTEDNVIFTLQPGVDTGLGYKVWPTSGMNGMIAISTKTIKTEDQLKRVLQMLDDLNHGDANRLIVWGWEGVTYQYDENGYAVYYTEEEKTEKGIVTGGYATGFNQVLPMFVTEENAADMPQGAPATSPIRKLEAQMLVDDIPYCVTNYGASYTSQYYVDNGVALDTIIDDAMVKYICGEIDEAGLDEAIKQWWSAGGEQVTKEMNELYHAAGN